MWLAWILIGVVLGAGGAGYLFFKKPELIPEGWK